jgi:HAD superfamily hydrolase (TIGR01549 family)
MKPPVVFFDVFKTLTLGREKNPILLLGERIDKLKDHMEALRKIIFETWFDSFESLGEAIARECGLGDAKPVIEALVTMDKEEAELWNWRPEAKSVLEELRRCGYRLAIISNCWFRSATAFERSEYKAYFEKCWFSCRTGTSKPSPNIFKAALRGMKIDAAGAVMIGDSEKYDRNGAKTVGIDCYLIDERTGLNPVLDWLSDWQRR